MGTSTDRDMGRHLREGSRKRCPQLVAHLLFPSVWSHCSVERGTVTGQKWLPCNSLARGVQTLARGYTHHANQSPSTPRTDDAWRTITGHDLRQLSRSAAMSEHFRTSTGRDKKDAFRPCQDRPQKESLSTAAPCSSKNSPTRTRVSRHFEGASFGLWPSGRSVRASSV